MNIENDFKLDQNIDIILLKFKELFPKITDESLRKNGDFIKLLEDYIEDDINGIGSFLDEKGFIVEGIKLLVDGVAKFSEEQIQNIENGKFHLGIKQFLENHEDPKSILQYFIIAKKKNKLGLDGIGENMKDFMSSFLGKKQKN